MARRPRKYSESGIYHVILRGINREKIFKDDCEKQKLLNILARNFAGGQTLELAKQQGRLYAFCILDNHVHLLIKESHLGISNLMQRVGTAYATFYNRRHGRSGPVFESRFTSCTVEGDRYFTNALKYIHNNPVRAGVVQKAGSYRWSSMYYYLHDSSDFLMKDAVVGNLSMEVFEASMSLSYSEDMMLKCRWPIRVSDFEIIMVINKICKIHGIARENIAKSYNVLRETVKSLLYIKGITKAQIARLLCIHQYELCKIIALF